MVGGIEEETPVKRDLSKRQDSHTMIQKIMEKEKKMQKTLKKQMDLQMAIIKDKAEKNEEKRRKALEHVKNKNIEIDNIGREAFKDNINDLENRLKTYEEEEASIERQKFVNFKNYMDKKEKKQ